MGFEYRRLCVAFLILGACILSGCQKKIHIFKDVIGPEQETVLVTPSATEHEDYNTGSDSRLAIFLTDEEKAHWLGLISGLKTIGIPFKISQNFDDIKDHDVVLVYPYISGRDVEVSALKAMRRYVAGGGTLIATNVLGGGLQDMFGFSSIKESKEHYKLHFSSTALETKGFEDKELSPIKIGSSKDFTANSGTNSYIDPKNPPIATYENGDAAIIYNTYGKGKAYALGINLGQILAKGYNYRQVDIAEHYVNHYTPILDALLILIENIYRDNHPNAVTLGTVPDGKSLSFILSHDVDYSESLQNAIAYAEHQQNEGIQATYFVQTKYIKDYNDKVFLDKEGAALVQELEGRGAEIGSHTVAHSNELWNFPIGSGKERYPDYRPFVQTSDITHNGTILGELRVSKFLLDHFLNNQEVTSFRPGFLSNPPRMPQALASTGYKYSSSTPANMALTHLPYQLTFGREFDTLMPVFEIPITVEDEVPPAMALRIDDGIELARKISKIEGVYVVLIHTDDVDGRLEFQRRIVDEVRPYAWMGSIRQFGDWWSARDQVDVDVSRTGKTLTVSLNAPKPITGLVLELSPEFTVTNSSITDVKRVDNGLLLGEFSGPQTIELRQ